MSTWLSILTLLVTLFTFSFKTCITLQVSNAKVDPETKAIGSAIATENESVHDCNDPGVVCVAGHVLGNIVGDQVTLNCSAPGVIRAECEKDKRAGKDDSKNKNILEEKPDEIINESEKKIVATTVDNNEANTVQDTETGSDFAPTEDDNDCPDNALTACCKQDGFGAQFNAMMSVYAYARIKNKPYCSSPWGRMEHGPEALLMYEFVGGDLYGTPSNKKTFRMRSAPKPWVQWYTDEARNEFRLAYFYRPKPNTKFFHSDEASFVWHVRRNDVSSEKHSDRFTSNQEIIEGIRTLKVNHPELKRIIFFSDGNPSEFSDINGYCKETKIDCFWDLGGDVLMAFHHMVMADYLITAKDSSFSAAAALLSNNTIYFDKTLAEGICDPAEVGSGHQPDSDWFQ